MDILNRYRENHSSSSSEDDSENSDNECAVWKRASHHKATEIKHIQSNGLNEDPLILPNDEKGELPQPQQIPEQARPNQKRKRNTIWCDVLQDQLISEDLEDCLLNKPRNYGSRGKESYDYTRAYSDKRRDSDSEMSGCSLNEDSSVDCNLKPKKKKFFPPNKKFVKLNSSELDAARKINKIIQEKKYYLIQRIVKFAGIEKAMHYLELTKEIEDNGGMMIKNQSRRRTPGGVYIQMLKEDKDTTQDVLDKIFEGELSSYEMKKFYQEKRKKKKNNKKNLKCNSKEASEEIAEAGIEPMEPGEIATMDAEVTLDEKSDALNSDIDHLSAPVIEQKPSGSMSDLEEGEIED